MFLFSRRIHPKASVDIKSHKLLQNNERENRGKKGSRKDSIEKQVRNEKLKLGSRKRREKIVYVS